MLKKVKAFLKLIRWFHELLVILPFISLYLIILYYAGRNGCGCHLSVLHFSLLCFCVQLLVAAGCVLNDIADRHIDKINKPLTHVVENSISLRGARIIFVILSLLIAFLSAYIAMFVFPEWAWISAAVYMLSVLYDLYFKRSPLMGNILMALLTAGIPFTLLFFVKDCIDMLNNPKIPVLIFLYAFFPALIIIPRELSLDISDMEGDKACGCRTLPIIIGAKRSKMVVAAFLILIVLISIPLSFKFSYLALSSIIVDILLIIYLLLLCKAERRVDYIRTGRLLWVAMILGLIGFTISTAASE